jgi:hypothetical protein
MVEITEKKLALVLLDLIDSTKFVQRNGALKSAKWLQYHDSLTRSLLYRFSGREIDRSDGFLLSFESCIDALNFALWYQKTIPEKTKIHCRIGIHYGSVAEVTQEDKYTLVGAKAVEIEGIAKNITARIMSICLKEQVLLSKQAYQVVRSRNNHFTPKGVRYACVGLYRFKGVKEPLEIYAVAEKIEALQPPPSNDKVKRLGGAKKIRSRMRDKRVKEWIYFLLPRLALITIIYYFALAYPCLSDPMCRKMWSIDPYFKWVDFIKRYVNFVKGVFNG